MYMGPDGEGDPSPRETPRRAGRLCVPEVENPPTPARLSPPDEERFVGGIEMGLEGTSSMA